MAERPENSAAGGRSLRTRAVPILEPVAPSHQEVTQSVKTEGRATKVWVYISQPRGLSVINFKDCEVKIKDQRVEIVLDSPQIVRGLEARHFNFPASLVAVAWV